MERVFGEEAKGAGRRRIQAAAQGHRVGVGGSSHDHCQPSSSVIIVHPLSFIIILILIILIILIIDHRSPMGNAAHKQMLEGVLWESVGLSTYRLSDGRK